MRLRQIDDLALPDHFHLKTGDHCWYITEFAAGRRFNYSEGNRLVCDLQIGIDYANTDAGWCSKKQRAVARAADLIHSVLTREQLLRPTWVPIPPSKSRNHGGYDSRILDVLLAIKAKEPKFDARELVLQVGDREPAKKAVTRRDVEALYSSYRIDECVVDPTPTVLVVFDDVVTTGSSFRAIERRLNERFPHAQIVGFFLARRAL